MAVDQTGYWVRVKVDGGGVDAYHTALALATHIAGQIPAGLTVEVMQDKVWASTKVRAENGS